MEGSVKYSTLEISWKFKPTENKTQSSDNVLTSKCLPLGACCIISVCVQKFKDAMGHNLGYIMSSLELKNHAVAP